MALADAELRNVMDMTDISVSKYLQVGVKDLRKDAIWPNLAFFGKICKIMQDFCV